ncbi:MULTISPECIES: excisionase family protein [Rahnella]|uniref:excisionase family protein n=1 Tax=Rahnella TaxID=34037 RepID=UPI003F6E3E9D
MAGALNPKLYTNKWLSQELLSVVTGLKPSIIKRALEASWVEGREYKRVLDIDDPSGEGEILYNREAIDDWIGKMPLVESRRRKRVSKNQ